jgi:hypothetical protein
MTRLADILRSGIAVAISCAAGPRPFALRAPLVVDDDTRRVSIACRPEPSAKEPARARCAPAEYVSPFVWDQVDNLVFAPVSRALSIEVSGEAANATSLDEVADSAWFDNRIGATPLSIAQRTLGACAPEDLLPDEVADGSWIVDHGKDNGSTLGFRVDVPGKGIYMLKADDAGVPERASAASVIGAALYNAAGFSTTCEQVVLVGRAQLTLKPGLTVTSNAGVTVPFDAAALDAALASSTQVAGRARMQASKWLPGLPLGPFRYIGVRDDDPNDVIAHEDRRELRGSRLLAAWINHWDAREQNSMDLWLADDAGKPRSSPGYVRHYIIDTSDTIGGALTSRAASLRLGKAYLVSLRDVMLDFVTFGALERPWDRARPVIGREKFGLFSERDFDPEGWRGVYPNPAMQRMTERDGAWMARIIARFTADDIRAIAGAGRFSDPRDTEYLVQVLLDRQHAILARYLTRLSPLSDVHLIGTDQLCAVDLARSSKLFPAERFHYRVVEIGAGRRIELAVTPAPDGRVCFHPEPLAPGAVPDAAVERRVQFEIDNGTAAGPLEVHAYDLGPRGMFVVGLERRVR